MCECVCVCIRVNSVCTCGCVCICICVSECVYIFVHMCVLLCVEGRIPFCKSRKKVEPWLLQVFPSRTDSGLWVDKLMIPTDFLCFNTMRHMAL